MTAETYFLAYRDRLLTFEAKRWADECWYVVSSTGGRSFNLTEAEAIRHAINEIKTLDGVGLKNKSK